MASQKLSDLNKHTPVELGESWLLSAGSQSKARASLNEEWTHQINLFVELTVQVPCIIVAVWKIVLVQLEEKVGYEQICVRKHEVWTRFESNSSNLMVVSGLHKCLQNAQPIRSLVPIICTLLEQFHNNIIGRLKLQGHQ